MIESGPLYVYKKFDNSINKAGVIVELTGQVLDTVAHPQVLLIHILLLEGQL
jgi:hypothetical protein